MDLTEEIPTEIEVDPGYAAVTARALAQDAADLKAAEEAALKAAGPPAPVLTVEQKAENLRELTGAIYVYGASASLVGRTLDVASFKVYLDRVMREAGNPTDPVERMLLEQLVQAHHVIGGLHVRAGDHKNLDASKIFHAAAARLMGEFRRSTLALKAYRSQTAAKQPEAATSADKQTCAPTPADKKAEAATTADKQGNAATSAEEVKVKPKPRHGKRRARRLKKVASHTELASNNRLNGYIHGEPVNA